MKKQKKYQEAQKKVTAGKIYTAAEAMALMPQVSLSKFAGTVELEVKLRLKDKQKNESLRGSYLLPNSFGKETKVLVFADTADKEKGEGADVSGGEELIKDVEAGKVEFDVVIASPAMMPKIAKLGKVLGTKGLMPTPKNGTVTTALDEAVKKFKSGMRNFKMNDGKITLVIGKTDMKTEDLTANFNAAMSTVKTEINKLGSNLIKSVKVKPTMGITVAVQAE